MNLRAEELWGWNPVWINFLSPWEKTVYRRKDLCRLLSSAVSGHGHVLETLWFWTCISQLLWLGQQFTWTYKCLHDRAYSSIFRFLRSLHLDAHSGRGNFRFHSPGPLSRHPCQPLLFLVSFMMSILGSELSPCSFNLHCPDSQDCWELLVPLWKEGGCACVFFFHFLYNLNINLLFYP